MMFCSILLYRFKNQTLLPFGFNSGVAHLYEIAEVTYY